MNARAGRWIGLMLVVLVLSWAALLLHGLMKDREPVASDIAEPLSARASAEEDGPLTLSAGERAVARTRNSALAASSASPPGLPAPPETQGFQPDAYAMGRMQIFGRFWKQAEEQWNAASFHLAERDAELLDGRQSYQVYVYLRTCLDAPRSPAQAERRLGELESAAATNPRLQNPRRLEWIFQQLEQGLARCDGLPDELEPLALKWLTRAATRGYPLAQIAYYRSYRWLTSRKPYLLFGEYDGVNRYRHKAAGFLQAALHSGHPEAFVEMGLALAEGVIFEASPVPAYAHALAAQQAAGPDLDLSAELRGRLEPHLDRDQIKEAGRMAGELCEQYCL